MKILLFGTFDHLHPGHHFVIRDALKRGETHVVVARDKNVLDIKGKLSKQNEKERLRALQEAFPEVKARLGDAEDFLSPVRTVAPDLILLGYDQKLPPGVSEDELPCPIERLPPFEPEKWKSSLQQQNT